MLFCFGDENNCPQWNPPPVLLGKHNVNLGSCWAHVLASPTELKRLQLRTQWGTPHDGES